MSGKMLVGLSRMIALQREVDVLANNVANQTTSGFKAKGVMFREYMQKHMNAEKEVDEAKKPALLVDVQTFTDFNIGSLRATGNPLDAAIVGDGFFALQTPAGERYTRAGTFMIDASGRLATTAGDLVLGPSGTITVPRSAGTAAIEADGRVSASGVTYGRLRLVRFENLQQLHSEGGVLFNSEQRPVEVAPESVRLAQGVVETSNVRGVTEMGRLMEASRSYQAVATVVMSGDKKDNVLKRLSEFE